MTNNHIKIFNNELEQNNYLKYINETNDSQIILNKKNKKISFAKDGTFLKDVKYNNENYLVFDINDVNNNFHVIPNDVTAFNIINNQTGDVISEKINSRYNKIYSNPIYKIGLMSDVHYNDTDDDETPDTYSNDGAEYSYDLINALSFFKNEGVDFIACSGDISTDDTMHLSNYKLCVDKYGNNLPVFTCSGNHDTYPRYIDHNLWCDVSILNNSEYDIIYFDDDEHCNNKELLENYHSTSFYFKKYYNNTFDVYIYLNVEYGWDSATSYNTHDCRRLTQEELLVHSEVNYDTDIHLYQPDTLRYLANILEEFKDHRCFIFTHLMLPTKAGNYHKSEELGNINYYDYCATHVDVLKGDQGEFIENLMNMYDNNYWFCGHSHYKWAWEKYDHNINITKTNNSYNIHLPSLSRPLPLEIYGYANAPKDSEAAIMEVYENFVVIKGAVLKESDNDNMNIYNVIYNFSDSQTKLVTENMFTYSNNSDIHVEQLEDGYVQIDYHYNSNISGDDNNLYLNNGLINSSNFGNYIPILRFDDIQIWYDEMDPSYPIEYTTGEILNDVYIGFRDNTSDSNYWYYYLVSNHIYTLHNNGLVFKVSSQSPNKNYHLHLKLKMRIGFSYVGYSNKFLPIACYKLSSKKEEV